MAGRTLFYVNKEKDMTALIRPRPGLPTESPEKSGFVQNEDIHERTILYFKIKKHERYNSLMIFLMVTIIISI